jgi:L-seryl-tRNA(Ser) seleniumtransferase
LALVSLAAAGEVLVSRGELVEIGGGFRVPEVLAASGCRLVEVGTTNKTRRDDYARAITPQTRAILRVHPSNYRVVGFTESTPLVDLVELAAQNDLVVIDDLGSGALDGDWVFRGEPDARGAIAAGVDVAAFSGDKLIGGPQCGILVGSAEAIARCASHPLMRALRPDKLTMAALDATLRLHQEQRTRRTIPTIRMLGETATVLQERANHLAAAIGGDVVQTIGRVGGGSLPLEEIVSYAVVVPAPEGPEVCAAWLRTIDPPIVARVADGRVLLDVLAMSDRDLEDVATAVGGP